MKRFLGAALVVAALAAASTARAQTKTTNPDYVFTTIDSVLRAHGSSLFLTGVLEGTSSPTQVEIHNLSTASNESLDSCERAAVLMMSKPGQYKLEAWRAPSSWSPPPYCRLSKVNP